MSIEFNMPFFEGIRDADWDKNCLTSEGYASRESLKPGPWGRIFCCCSKKYDEAKAVKEFRNVFYNNVVAFLEAGSIEGSQTVSDALTKFHSLADRNGVKQLHTAKIFNDVYLTMSDFVFRNSETDAKLILHCMDNYAALAKCQNQDPNGSKYDCNLFSEMRTALQEAIEANQDNQKYIERFNILVQMHNEAHPQEQVELFVKAEKPLENGKADHSPAKTKGLRRKADAETLAAGAQFVKNFKARTK
jgi:hypothetical protein